MSSLVQLLWLWFSFGYELLAENLFLGIAPSYEEKLHFQGNVANPLPSITRQVQRRVVWPTWPRPWPSKWSCELFLLITPLFEAKLRDLLPKTSHMTISRVKVKVTWVIWPVVGLATGLLMSGKFFVKIMISLQIKDLWPKVGFTR